MKVQSEVALVLLCGYTHWDARKIRATRGCGRCYYVIEATSSGIGRAVGEVMPIAVHNVRSRMVRA